MSLDATKSGKMHESRQKKIGYIPEQSGDELKASVKKGSRRKKSHK
jgi:hypothetical protein